MSSGADRAPIEYLKWYYETNVWKDLHYRGVRTLKFPPDMWNYQELVFENDIHWIVETGTRHGGSALFFADLLAAAEREGMVLSIDITHDSVHAAATVHPRIQLLLGDSTAARMVQRIRELIPATRSSLLLILDSDHSRAHVLGELDALVPLLRSGDYLVVEDTIVNGNPVRPDFGPGPLEAIDAFVAANPGKLVHDAKRESKFGCSFALRGYYKVA